MYVAISLIAVCVRMTIAHGGQDLPAGNGGGVIGGTETEDILSQFTYSTASANKNCKGIRV